MKSEIPTPIERNFDLFNQQIKEYDENLDRVEVGPGLFVYKDEFGANGRYFVEKDGKLKTAVSMDHEGGVHNVSWTIDQGDDGPLFQANYNVTFGTPQISLGIVGRNPFPIESQMYHMLLANYEFNGQTFLFTPIFDIPGFEKRSLLTGEKGHLIQFEVNGIQIIDFMPKTGLIERLEIPSSLSLIELTKINNYSSVFNPKMPYLNFPEELGVSFSTYQLESQ